MEDFLIVSLSIPLINKSLQMDFYKFNNIPTLHPEHKVQFSYIVKGEYLAICASCTFEAIPTLHEIHIWLVTQCKLCVLNTALLPVEKIKWCIYALFIKESKVINTHCLQDSQTGHADLALNLSGYIWAVSSLFTEHIQIHTKSLSRGNLSGNHCVPLNNGCERL